mgnify:CR=1 FL=1
MGAGFFDPYTNSGLIGPIGGFFADIPQPVVGGMVTFLFANVMVSGIQVTTMIAAPRARACAHACARGRPSLSQ